MTSPSAPPRGVRRVSLFDRPVFVLGAPGSGADRGADVLGALAGFELLRWSGDPFAAAPKLTPSQRGWDSARLGARDAKALALEAVEADWLDRLAQHRAPTLPYRLVASLPGGVLQIPFLREAFPTAQFLIVQRDVTEAVPEALAAWRDGSAVTHPELPGWAGPAWSFPLTPQWRLLDPHDLPSVVADQWRKCTETLVADTARLAPQQWLAIGHRDLYADPERVVREVVDYLGTDVPESVSLPRLAPLSEDVAPAVVAPLGDINSRARELVTRRPTVGDSAGSPLRSISTSTFPELLDKLGASLLLTTYQSGRLVVARVQDGQLNTHFRAMESPMGIAARPGLLAVGTKTHVWTYTDLPDLAPRLDPEGRHDAAYAPRSCHFTGDIRIHDIAYAAGELWAVATRFSCLATFDAVHSFVPRWSPPFISELLPEDRCHLNGLAVVDDKVKYVTALGTTDTEGGWRPDKARGGVIIDVETNQVIASGLSMPHSPRWHHDSLWVLESGEGQLCRVDVDTGAVETVAELPGFTRGLAFAGRYAFVGLSEVREATTFGGLPLTARLENRECGVWVVDIVTGETVGFLRFEDAVQEVFDVTLLRGTRFPEVFDVNAERLANSFALPQVTHRGS